MTDPYYTDDTLTLYQGDALTVLRDLPASSVDCVVTSPPYYGLRDYGTEGQYGLESSPAAYVETMRAVFAEVRRVLADDGTLWLNIGDGYSGSATMTGTKSMRQRLNDSHLRNQSIQRGATEMSPKNMLGIPWRVAFALQDDGWTLRNDIIWHKPNAMPESVTDRLSCRYEHVFLLTKNRRYWFDLDPIREPHAEVSVARSGRAFDGDRQRAYPGNAQTLDPTTFVHPQGRNPGDVWTIPTQPFPGAHFAAMPLALASRCIQAGCTPRRCITCGHAPERIVERTRPPELDRPGRAHDIVDQSFQRSNLSGQEWNAWKAANPDRHLGWTDCGHDNYQAGTVLDPFSGSGTTGLAAARHGCRYIGIDLNAEYLDMSLRTRLAQTSLLDEGTPA